MKRILTGVFLLVLSMPDLVAQPALSEGVSLLDQRRFQEAANFFSGTVKLFPRDAQSWHYLSKAYLGTGSYDSAEIAGRKSIQYDDENPAAYAALGEALTQQRKFQDAAILLREGLSESKNHPQLLLQLGFLQLAMDSLDASLVTFSRAREVAPKLVKTYEGIGDVYAKQGVFPMAVGQYEKAIELDPGQPDVLNKLAELHLKERRYNDAVRWLQKVVDLDTTNHEARFKLGNIYYRAKLYVRAARVFEEFVRNNPNDTAAVKMYVESLFNSRQFKTVPEYADLAIKLDPAFSDAIRMKAVSYYALKDYQKAVDAYGSFAQAGGGLTGEDYQYLGRSHQELEKPDEAVAEYEKAVGLDSSLTLVMNDAGTLYMKLKKWDDAARMFKARFTYDSTAVTAYINYAQCMLVLERFDEAARSLEVAIQQAPDYVPSYTRLGIAYLQMKDYQLARRWFERTIEVIDTNGVKYQSDLAQSYRYVGLVLLLDKNWNDAIKNLKRSLDLEPKDESTLLWMAQGLQNAQKKDEAIKYYKEVLKVNKKNEQALKGLEVLEGNSE